MNKDDRAVESIIEEYKMSMGGSFFNKIPDKDLELEVLKIENGVDKHLFNTYKLLSIYDSLSEYNKREFFQKVTAALIEFNEQVEK